MSSALGLKNKKDDPKRSNLSDSEGSESNSVSQESLTETKASTTGVKRLPRRTSEWDILEGLRDGERYEEKPDVFKGYLQKKRKWPLKGWHKRYFVLDCGILKYGKSPGDVSRGKIHGSVNIGLSVISTKSKRKRIDIDAEEFIYHLKAKQYEVFEEWREELKKHRLYRQHLLTFGSGIGSNILGESSTTMGTSAKQPLSRKLASEGSPPHRLQWALDGPLQVAMTELNHTQEALNQLSKILDRMEQNHESESLADGFSPSVQKKDRRRFGLRKKKSNKGSSVDLSNSPPDHTQQCLTPGGSSPQRPVSGEMWPDSSLPSDFTILASDICSTLKSVIYTLQTEKERLKGSNEEKLRTALTNVLQENSELRSRLKVVHKSSDLTDLPDAGNLDQQEFSEALKTNDSLKINEVGKRILKKNEHLKHLLHKIADITNPIEKRLSVSSNRLQSSLSYSSCASEYLDARQSLSPSETSSPAPSSEDLSDSSVASDMAGSEYNIVAEDFPLETGRRSTLPAPQPSTEGLSLWNLLSKNIGKDLSQVSMPVALNEPLNMLQRLCEELEYSELLDHAATLTNPYDRMVYVAAFAVSAYGSTYYRAGSKPFNPLLGETYECIREDKGFKFVSEQVSHHPPISVCHASSKNFTFWADSRIKTKFWGRSMEFQPMGIVHLKLERPDGGPPDVYQWNKVTSCVHNLFGGERYVDQYGELVITSQNISCTLNFVKASFWSQKKHEVIGAVMNESEKLVVRKLFGKWSEALYCGDTASSAKCIWRQGTMPPDYSIYYGFTRFAIELNELQPDLANQLPITDTRFRPDQRLLEEGKLEEAERVKMSLEQNQRERRKKMETEGIVWRARWFRRISLDEEEDWELTDYWTARKNGFVNYQIEPLW